jgi:hypothetical protein
MVSTGFIDRRGYVCVMLLYFCCQRDPIQGRNMACILESKTSREIAYVGEFQSLLPSRVSKHAVNMLVDVESLHPVSSPVMRYKT